MRFDHADEFWQELIAQKIISEDQLQQVKNISGHSGDSLHKASLKLGIFTEKELLDHLSAFHEIPVLDLSTLNLKNEIIQWVPKNIATRYRIIPIFKIGQALTLATCDPQNYVGIEQVQRINQLEVKMVLASESSILKAIEKYYGSDASALQRFDTKPQDWLDKKTPGDASAMEDPTISFVNHILEQAVLLQASDIHIEPEEKYLRIRIRIDGILQETATPPKESESAIISRLKIMAGMNIAEKRKPQDGRCKLLLKGKEVDCRISTIPTHHGENMVIRLLDQSQLILPLEKLGFSKEMEIAWKQLISKPYGMLLVTGPTGSGKTTALYSSLNRMNTSEINIVTIEDPIEYQVEGIRQMQVNPKLEITFATGLRHILRQDPDAIMVGEIRDSDTALVAVQAALTGHLVMSTLHTNDSASTPVRLIDMGIEPFLVSSSVLGVLACRLVRLLCNDCKEACELSDEESNLLKQYKGMEKPAAIYRPVGCEQCHHKGYSGRLGIFELLQFTPEIKALIQKRATADNLRDEASRQGMKSLFEHGLMLVVKGQTSLEELYRVARYQ